MAQKTEQKGHGKYVQVQLSLVQMLFLRLAATQEVSSFPSCSKLLVYVLPRRTELVFCMKIPKTVIC